MQLSYPDKELRRLEVRVAEDHAGALSDHSIRMGRFKRYLQKWRNRVEAPAAGEEDESNFSVPLVQWQTYSKWAEVVQSIFGGDAEIMAKPTGPADQKIVHKVGRYMTWRVLDSMALVTPLSIFLFRAILFGRSHAYRPYKRETFITPEKDNNVWYEGPGFEPLQPDDLIVPAERVDSIQDFSFVIHQDRLTPQQLLDEERAKRCYGITDNFEKILQFSQHGSSGADDGGDDVKMEQDEAEGVTPEGAMTRGDSLRVLNWYGRWRPLKGTADGDEHDLKKRYADEIELLVRYLPDLNLIVGIRELMEMYPNMRHRRPFEECALIRDGSYWPAGFGELLESIEDEATANHNLFTRAGQFSVGPLIFYRPGSGYDPAVMQYSPYTAVPTEDPAGVNVVQMRADLSYCVAKDQSLTAISERLTGNSDHTVGRASDRATEPKTATGLMALMEKGNVRAALNTTFFREDLKRILLSIWMLDSEFAPESVFFRVTEEDAKGLFAPSGGGAMMTSQERGGRYDFDIRFATSPWDKETRKQDQMQLYGADLQNPLIIENPRALWLITNQLHRALGDERFADIIPEPPDLGQPKNPREEWTLCLQGEDCEVNPQDNDDLHLVDHYRRLKEAKQSAQPDPDAISRMVGHIIQHQSQKRQKMMMQALTQQLTETLAGNTANPAGGGLNLRGPVPMPLMEAQGLLEDIANPEELQQEGGGGQQGGQPQRKPPGRAGA